MQRKAILFIFAVLFLKAAIVFGDTCQTLKFAVIGDRTGREKAGYFESKVIESLNLLQPEFVVNAGDNIKGYTEDVNDISKQWDVFDASIKKINMPFYRTVGNHDITNDVMEGVYKKRYGQPYHYYLHKDVLFLFVSTEDPPVNLPDDVKNKRHTEIKGIRKKIKKSGYTAEILADLKAYEDKSLNLAGARISDEQVDYFKNVLKKNKNVRWTFVLMHKRAWKERNPDANWLKLEKLLAGRSYTVFAGHEHKYEYTNRNGHDYIGLGTAGGGWLFPDTVAGVYDHVMLVTVGDGEPVMCNILLDSVFGKTDVRAITAR